MPALQGTLGGEVCQGPQTWGCPQPPSPAGRAVGRVRSEGLNALLQRIINPCPEFLWLCHLLEGKPLTAASLRGFVGVSACWAQPGAAKASLCQLCQHSPPGAGVPAAPQAQGCSSSNPPAQRPPRLLAGAQSHSLHRDAGPVSTCAHNKPTATNCRAPNLHLAEKPHGGEEEDERKR